VGTASSQFRPISSTRTLTPYQGPEDLKIVEIASPTPKPDEYLIAIEAAATNFFDLLQIRGKYQHQPPLPWTAGAEFAGRILRAPASPPGGRAPRFRPGDRVFGASQGSFADQILAREEQLRPVPRGWSSFDAAGLFVTAPTSYGALVTRAGVKQGDWVLVHAAAGGVGLAAVQIAKAFGATVVATAGTPHKLEVAKRFGADHVVDYRQKDWPEQVKKLTPKGRGVDIVYDPVGKITESTKCTAWNGRLLVIGFAGGDIEKVATNRILLKNISLVGLHWGMYAKNEPETVETVWKGLYELMESGKLKGTCFTDREFVGLQSVPEALRALGGRETWGKVVVKLPQSEAKL
jgi:NADPH:quinone reductase